MDLQMLKMALADTLKNIQGSLGNETDPELLRYLSDILRMLNHTETLLEEELVLFFIQIQQVAFGSEAEETTLTLKLGETSYHVPALFETYSLSEIVIKDSLLTPLGIHKETSRTNLKALAQRLIPPRVKPPLLHTPEAQQALTRHAQSQHHSKNHSSQAGARHPLEINSGTIIFEAFKDMFSLFAESGDNPKNENLYHHDFW